MSGSLVLRSGVGTQMLTVSSVATTEKSVVALELALLRPASATSCVGTSGMYDSPRVMASTFRWSRSMPTAVRPPSAELDGQRQSDVAEADDSDAGGAAPQFLSQLRCKSRFIDMTAPSFDEWKLQRSYLQRRRAQPALPGSHSRRASTRASVPGIGGAFAACHPASQRRGRGAGDRSVVRFAFDALLEEGNRKSREIRL